MFPSASLLSTLPVRSCAFLNAMRLWAPLGGSQRFVFLNTLFGVTKFFVVSVRICAPLDVSRGFNRLKMFLRLLFVSMSFQAGLRASARCVFWGL